MRSIACALSLILIGLAFVANSGCADNSGVVPVSDRDKTTGLDAPLATVSASSATPSVIPTRPLTVSPPPPPFSSPPPSPAAVVLHDPDETITLTERFLLQGKKRRTASAVDSLAFSPDGQLIAVGAGYSSSLRSGGVIELWDAQEGKMVAQLEGHGAEVHGVAFSPDGKMIAGGGYQAILWDTTSKQKRFAVKKTVTHPENPLITALAFSPDGKTLVVNSGKLAALQVWDIATGRKTADWAAKAPFAYSADGRWLVASGGEKGILLLDQKTGEPTERLGDAVPLRVLKFSPDGSLLFVAYDNELPGMFWNMETRSKSGELNGEQHYYYDAAFSPDGQLLATGDIALRLWSVPTGKLLWVWTPVSSRGINIVNAVAFSPDGKLLAAGCADRKVRVWSLTRNAGP